MHSSAVFSLPDMETVYAVPETLHEQRVHQHILGHLQIEGGAADLSDWKEVVWRRNNPERTVKIALVGKYLGLKDSYKSLLEAVSHAGIHLRVQVDIKDVESDTLTASNLDEHLAGVDGILVPGGFGERGYEGKVLAAGYARRNRIPYLGICLGLQVAVLEFARAAAGMSSAASTEIVPDTKYPLIALVTEWREHSGEVQQRDANSDLGGTMRLGVQRASLCQDSLAHQIYSGTDISERHRHRYEVNENLLAPLLKKGLAVSGRSEDGLVETVEIPDHPWFFACQYHPEFQSTPRDAHPVFIGFVSAVTAREGGA